MPFLRKYNTLLVTGTTSIRIPIIKRAAVDFAVGADWTPTAGDVKVFVDAAAAANITNLPTAIASGNGAFWEFIITAAELTCKQLLVVISDAATKAVEDQSFIVETYGNASAMYVTDFSAQLATPTNITGGTITTVTNLTNLPAITSNWLTAAGIAATALNGKGDWNIGKTGYSLTQAFPANFADLAITVTTGLVTLAGVTHTGAVIPTVTTLTNLPAITANWLTAAGIAATALNGKGDWNIGKTGYSLTQAFPTNFADLAITVTTGRMTAGTIVDGAIGSATFAAGAINAAAIATGAIDADALATDAVTEIADGILDRNMATGTDSGAPTLRTVRQSLRAGRNRVAISAGTATVYKEDDATASWTAVVTTTAGNPISEVDPASA